MKSHTINHVFLNTGSYNQDFLSVDRPFKLLKNDINTPQLVVYVANATTYV